MKVAGYCRVSTDKEDQANSFQAQQRYFREYIGHHPEWELYEIYADEGITGTSTRRRIQFNRMIADACDGKFQLILTKEISRFSRNILDTVSYTRRLKAQGVGVLFMTENLNTLDPEAELLLTVMGTIAQEESRRTSVRVKWGQTRQMERGIVFGRSMLGYEVRQGRIRVEPEGARIVRLIFRKYGVEKKGTSVIVRELEDAGYRTHGGSLRWHPGQIIKILRNEKYVGDLIQKKTYTPDYLTHAKKANRGEEPLVILRDHHEPIVSRELWDTVQRELETRNRRSHRGSGRQYLFSGKIRCGQCGGCFVARQKKRADGSKLHRWSCAGKGCSVGMLLRDDDAMEMLKTALAYLRLDRDGLIGDVIKTAGTHRQETAEMQHYSRQEIIRLQRKRTALMDTYFSGDISREEMQSMRTEYEKRLCELHALLKSNDESPVDDARKWQFLAALLSGKAESEVFYRSILDQITVFRDRHMELRLKELPVVFRFVSGLEN